MNSPFENQLVSIIIPVYNSEKYIANTIDSALNQTYKNIEIVLINDCSKDNSAQILDKYLETHKNITYYLLEKNSGAAVARNKAIEMAKGRYIAFLDSDDLWYPQKLQKQLDLMKKENAAICYTAIEMVDENGQIIKGKRSVLEKVDYKFLLKNTMLATSTIVIDRKLIGKFEMPLLRSGQDYATWLSLMHNGIQAYGINEALVQYRKGRNSLSSKKIRNIKKVWNIQTKYEKINPLHASVNSICYAINAFKKHNL